ncbi:MAG: aminotransferase class V-fold PLP-dependent enzyme [Betaproteobacteria bacterium]|nr:aminotransferase class V-fold PLP-dependent enzyme [Betaproteobacteria bacterium]
MKLSRYLCAWLAALVFSAAAYALDSTEIRNLVDGLDAPVTLRDGSMVPAVNFDNAATTPAFKAVLSEILEQSKYYASIGRGTGQKSKHTTELYEKYRGDVLAFFNANPDKYAVIYVANTTDGMNRLSMMLLEKPDDLVLTTRMEHHANDLPWRFRGKTIYADVDAMGRLNVEDLERLLIANRGKVKYVTVSAASNATGYINDVHRIAKIAHRHGAKIVVDGAQIASHRKFSITGADPSEDIDYFVFSAHKMYAPFGGGAIIGLKSEFDRIRPVVLGGGNVQVVSDATVAFDNEMPTRHDAGSPNYFGVIAMQKAMELLSRNIGFDYIEQHERILMRKGLDELKGMDDIILYGDSEKIDDRVGILLFNIKGMEAAEVAEELAEMRGIAVRTGAFCSHPYAARLMGISDKELSATGSGAVFPRMIRASFGVYNTEEELDILIATLKEIIARNKTAGN